MWRDSSVFAIFFLQILHLAVYAELNNITITLAWRCVNLVLDISFLCLGVVGGGIDWWLVFDRVWALHFRWDIWRRVSFCNLAFFS